MEKENEKRGRHQESSEQLTFSEQVAHLSSGYSNSQAVVRFLDTKAAAVVGVIPVILGILAAVLSWLHESVPWKSESSYNGIYFLWLLPCILLALPQFVFAYRALHFAFRAIAPRDLGESPPSVLFPFRKPLFESRVDVLTNNPTTDDVIEDYRRQVLQMSDLVVSKMTDVKSAIHNLMLLMVFTLFDLGVMLIASGLCSFLLIGIVQ